MKIEPIELPNQLEGKWKNAVFLTYGVDILFFERVIWQNRWRNIIIIGDGIRLSDSLQGYEGRDDIRWANRKYIVDGVYGTTFHPKMILLTSHDSGRLFIGSGNLGFPGYSSGGEMFTQYDYDPEHTEYISEFINVRAYLDGLISRHYLRLRTEKQLLKLFEDSPWVYRGSVLDSEHVISNSERPFLDQFVEKLDNEVIDELLILAPFYDEKIIALKRLIKELNPSYTEIFLQEGQTSIDPKVLEELVEQSRNKIDIKLIELGDDNTYVHNKLYVAKTVDKAVCLQGSPNLSISAFLITPPKGNFELASILVGGRDEFDPLFEHLLIKELSSPVSHLNLKYLGGFKDEIEEAYASSPFWVLGAEWQDDILTIFYKGQLEKPEHIAIEVAEVQYPLNIKNFDRSSIEVKLSNEVLNFLSGNCIIRFIWDGEFKSGPILPFNITELDKSISISEEGEHLSNLGDLDLNDKDFEELLHELDGSLIIDGQSVVKLWRTGDHKAKEIDWDDETALKMAYEEIDYDLLRSHPRLEQYRTWNIGSGGSNRKTDLQVILSSITSHFQGLIDTAQGKQDIRPVDNLPGTEESGVDQENAEEVEAEEAEREKRRQSGNARKRKIMKAFIHRYIKGISSVKFLKIVDHDVIANNYVIFSHVLWRLFSFEWIEEDFVADSALKMMQFMWGDSKERKGYFHLLDEQGKSLCADIIVKSQGVGRLFATIFYIDFLVTQSDEKEFRLELRNFLRHILISMPFEVTSDILIEVWLLLGPLFIYNPPLPSDIVTRLELLVNWETQESFLRNIERTEGIRKHGCRFSAFPVTVMRPAVRELVQIRQLEFIDSTGIDNQERAEIVCRLWMKFQPMDFYRMTNVDGKILFLYDREYQKGLYVNRDKGIEIDILALQPYEHIILDTRLAKLKEIATQAMEKIKVNDFSLID